MSRPSIYEKDWINLVFENRNKEYGAYQLRQESSRTSVFALFMGLLLCTSFLIIPRITNLFQNETVRPIETIIPIDEIITVTDILQEEIKTFEEPAAAVAVEQIPVETIPEQQLVNPTIVHATEAVQDIARNTDNVVAVIPTTDGSGITGLNPTSGNGNGTGTNPNGNGTASAGENIVTTNLLDQQPEFPGGISKFYSYVGNHFRTPEMNTDNLVKIYVSFVVEKDGSMSAIRVTRDPGYGLGAEAIRVLKSLKTKWKPGIINSQAVRTAYSLPIVVQIN